MLPTRPLGRTGLSLTIVGFGAWAIGGGDWSYYWGPQDHAASRDAMGRVLALSLTWIDTAAVYGLGHSEEVVGRLLGDLRGPRPAGAR
jgi:aryl-alcohol dehydrogenase-like predicted oxidoreductase